MKTLTIQIGNSDNKLTQEERSTFVFLMNDYISGFAEKIHFFGGSVNWAIWQNVAWVITIKDEKIDEFKKGVKKIRDFHKQDSVALTEGNTELI